MYIKLNLLQKSFALMF